MRVCVRVRACAGLGIGMQPGVDCFLLYVKLYLSFKYEISYDKDLIVARQQHVAVHVPAAVPVPAQLPSAIEPATTVYGCIMDTTTFGFVATWVGSNFVCWRCCSECSCCSYCCCLLVVVNVVGGVAVGTIV